MSFEIENRVSKSPIQSIDLSDFLINKEFDTFDISFSDAKISVDYEDFTKKYYGDNGVNVIVNKNKSFF